jgi:hypothetical protein
MDWIDLVQDDRWRALLDAVVNLRVPYNVEDFLTKWGTVSFPERTILYLVRH